MVRAGQSDLVVEHGEQLSRAVLIVTEKQSCDSSLSLKRVRAEDELHGVGLHDNFHEKSATTAPANFHKRLKVYSFWHKRWLLGKYLEDLSRFGIFRVVAQDG